MNKLASILLAAVVLAGPALAEEPAPPMTPKARARIKRARALYDAGHHDRAVAEYLAAYEAAPVPDILFNVGQIWRTKPNLPKAIAAYEQYLEAAPEGRHADDAKAHIQALYRELVPEAQRETYDAVKRELAAYQARHGDALDARWEAIKQQLKAGDGDVAGLLAGLHEEIERREAQAEAAEARAAAKAPAPATLEPPRARREAPLLKKWWLWTAVGGGVAVIALSVGLGVGLSGDRDPTPTIGVLR